METPALSCNTDAFSHALVIDSDDEGPQSSMWVRQEGHTSSELPSDFLEPLSPGIEVISPLPPQLPNLSQQQSSTHDSRQFWKSGDFVGSYDGATFATEGMDHARVHPKFLHSNATSHKWVLGAIAELLDNSVDEIRNGATFVKVDVIANPRNGDPMLVIEDDGGGMDPQCMRRCMSLGYSAKSKLCNTIGQYGNGFKTSTMRLGADVIVFSRSGVSKPSESIGMMSYTFLTATGQNDIVVPIVDFQIEAFGIRKLIRSNVDDWVESMEAIEKWSPYSSQTELVNQFKSMPRCQGTRVIIYNLWEDEEGLPELDFTTDPIDIQIRATSRDEKNLKMATRYSSCRHYLTYRHSLRSYTSILYLRLPSRFRIFLRGKQVQHHSLRNEMMLVEEVTYRPKDAGHSKAVVTLGFVKDASEHLDISGFNVYHKNRLIKPFWRIWNPSDTRGRGIIGILEANFVEPAHDKQGFERTIVLSRLEARLVEMQKSYWSKNCHRIGYTNASLKKHVRPNSVHKNGAANSGKMETGQRDAQYMSVVDSAVANVQSAANGGGDVSYAQGIIGKEPKTLGISSALMMLPMQEACLNPTRLEMQEQNLLFGSMDVTTSGVGKSTSVSFGRQASLHVSQQGIFLGKAPGFMQDAALNPTVLDSQTFYPFVSSDVSLNNLQITSLGPGSLDLQTLRLPLSTGMASIVIDLESPDKDQSCDDAAFEISCPENCDAPKPTTEDCLMRCTTARESTLPSRERSDDLAMCLEGNEARGLNDASSSFPAVLFSDKVEGPPSRLSKTVASLDKVALMNQVEARAESLGMESCALLSGIVTSSNLAMPIRGLKDLYTNKDTGERDMESLLQGKTVVENAPCQAESLGMESCAQLSGIVTASNEAPLAMPIGGFKDLYTNKGTGERDMESLLQGKTVLENAPCQNTTLINTAGAEASDPLRLSTISAEGPVSAIFELEDLFDSLTSEDGMRPHSPQPVKARNAFVTSPVVDMDLTLPDILENATLENDSLLLNSSETLNRSDTTVGIVRHDNDSVAHENMTNNCQLPSCEDVVNDSASVQLSSEREIQLVARVLTEIDAAISNFQEQGDACLITKQTLEENDEEQHVSVPVRDQLLAMPVSSAARSLCLEQEGRSTLIRQGVIQETSNNNQASNEGIQKNMARVSQSAMFGASNRALRRQDLAIVHKLATAAVATTDVSRGENGSSKLLFAKQKIESLQRSIEAVVAEADVIREQLQQQRQLQDLDMRNLSMEMERAFSRLEELKR